MLFDRFFKKAEKPTLGVIAYSSDFLEEFKDLLISKGYTISLTAPEEEAFIRFAEESRIAVQVIIFFLDTSPFPDRAVRTLRQIYPDTQILLLSFVVPFEEIKPVLEAGALGLVYASAEFEEIRDAISSVVNGKKHLPDLGTLLLMNRKDQ